MVGFFWGGFALFNCLPFNLRIMLIKQGIKSVARHLGFTHSEFKDGVRVEKLWFRYADHLEMELFFAEMGVTVIDETEEYLFIV